MLKSAFTIFPESSYKTAWDCLGFVFIVYQSIMIPYNLSFGVHPDGFWDVLDTTIDCFFILDLCKKFAN